MNKRKVLTILVVVVLLALLGVMAYIFIGFFGSPDEAGEPTRRPLFPFNGGGDPVVEPSDTGDTTDDTPDDGVLTDEDVPVLRKIADFPTTDMTSYYIDDTVTLTREIQVESVPVVSAGVVGDEDTDSETEAENPDISDESVIITETVTEIIDVQNLFVRYNSVEEGYIYESKINDEITQRQVSNTELPNIQEAVYNTAGTRTALRFFNENSNSIETYNGYLESIDIPDAVCSASINTEYTQGDTNPGVRILEEFLVYTLENDDVDPDEEFNSTTANLLRTFQEQRGLDSTGTPDEATRSIINNECVLIAEERVRNQRPRELTGGFMNSDILTTAVSPDGSSMVYAIPNDQRTLINVYDFETGETNNIYSLSFSEWLLQWATEDKITLTTKAASNYPGSLYNIDPKERSLERVLTDIPGLTTNTSPNGQRLLVSESTPSDKLSLYALQLSNRALVELDLSTLPEKCVWSDNSIDVYCGVPNGLPTGRLPDNWYKELLTFNDNIWHINTNTGETNLLANPSLLTGESMDITKLQLDSKELYLFFINKKTGEPWVLTLE